MTRAAARAWAVLAGGLFLLGFGILGVDLFLGPHLPVVVLAFLLVLAGTVIVVIVDHAPDRPTVSDLLRRCDCPRAIRYGKDPYDWRGHREGCEYRAAMRRSEEGSLVVGSLAEFEDRYGPLTKRQRLEAEADQAAPAFTVGETSRVHEIRDGVPYVDGRPAEEGESIWEEVPEGVAILRATEIPTDDGKTLVTIVDPERPGVLLGAAVRSAPAPACSVCHRTLESEENCFGLEGRLYCEDCGVPE